MSPIVARVLQTILDGGADASRVSQEILQFDRDDFHALLSNLLELPTPEPDVPAELLIDAALRQLHHEVLRGNVQLDDELRNSAADLYKHLGSKCRPRRHLFGALASSGEPGDLQDFVRLAVEDPPADSNDASAAMAPLFQRMDFDAEHLFPDLLDALAHPQLAPAVLDLANYLFRGGRADNHPATQQTSHLMGLLQGVCARLREIEQSESGQLQAQDQQSVSDAVAIACALCDALGLVGEDHARAALCDALDLRHRRVRVEAAAALARLGDDEGVTTLAQMAEYPITRQRAVTYAEELGLEDHLDERWTTPEARAESELACFLAEPGQLGAPPAEMELLDRRQLAWPSFDQPQDCYLFRFGYHLGDATYTNVGIVGPLVHAFHVDLTQLPFDDQYAIFAGWQAEHPELREIPVEEFNEAHQAIATKIAQRLKGENLRVDAVVALGLFFGETALIAIARRGEQVGAIVAGESDAAWFPRDENSPRPLGPEEAWNIYKGRRLLETFNREAPIE